MPGETPLTYAPTNTNGIHARTNALLALCLGRRTSDIPGLLAALRADERAVR